MVHRSCDLSAECGKLSIRGRLGAELAGQLANTWRVRAWVCEDPVELAKLPKPHPHLEQSISTGRDVANRVEIAESQES